MTHRHRRGLKMPNAALTARTLAQTITFALFAMALSAEAKTLRWSTQGDPQTMDPYSQNENLTNNVNGQVYEKLADRDRQLNIVPVLALSWQQMGPLVWRFKLRPNVKFHDGTPFTADDVVFSLERSKHANSQLRQYSNAVGTGVRIDDLSIARAQERVQQPAAASPSHPVGDAQQHQGRHRPDNWLEVAWVHVD